MGSAYGSLNRQINNKVGVIKKKAPYQPLTPVQDEEEEEIVSLASSFDNEVDPFEVEQAPTPAPAFVIGGPVNLNADGIDLNAQVAKNKYGGALKYSQLSDSDKAIVDARRATGQDASPNAYRGATALMSAVDYGSGTQYDTREEALSGLSGFLGSFSDKRKATDEEFSTLNYDPSEFTMSGVSPKGGVSKRAATNSAIDYITKNNIPLSIEVDGQTRYLTTGLGSDVYRADDNFEYEAGSYQDFGPVGTYSTLHVESESVWAGMPAPLRIGLAVLTSGGSEAFIAGTKAIEGETLHAEDYLSIALPTLQYADILVPPVDAVTADVAKGIEAAPAVAGKGVLGLSYNSSKALLTGVVTGDPIEAVATAFGPKLVNQALEKAGVGDALNTFAVNNNINPDDLEAGIDKTINALAQGDNIEEALLKGVGKYVAEGGTILPDVIEDALGDAAKKVGDLVEPVTNALSTINDSLIKPVTKEVGGLLSGADTTARQALSALDDNVIQPLTENVGDALSQADTAVRQGLATFDEEVLQPVTQPLGDALEDAAQATGDVIEDVGQATGNVIEDVGQATGDVVEDVGQAVGDVVEDVGQAVGDVAEDVGQAVGDVAEDVGQVTGDVVEDVAQVTGDVVEDVAQVTGDVVEDVAQVTGDVLSSADTTARNVLSEVDDAFINPAGDIIEDVAQATGNVIEDVGQVVGDVAEDVSQEVGDALSAAETAVRQALEDIDLPEIDIDLPEIDIDLPDLDINLPDLDINLNVPQVTSTPSATRTTGGLFDVAQFEHDKGISLIGNLLTGLTEQDANKLSRKQYQQPKEEEVVDLLSDPFANAFNYKV